MNIRSARKSDLVEVANICDSVQFDKCFNAFVASSQGFLVTSYTESDYEKFFNLSKGFYIAEIDGKVAGWLLGLNSDYEDAVTQRVNDELEDSYLYVRQICCSPAYFNKGVGSSLYKYCFEKHGISDIVAEVLSAPMNEKSMNFHKKHGFEFLCEHKSVKANGKKIFHSHLLLKKSGGGE